MIHFNKTICRLSITQRLWAGFGMMLVLLVVLGSQTLFSLSDAQQRVQVVTAEAQPALLASMALNNRLKDASNAMGFYLLSKETAHKQAYLTHLSELGPLLQELKQATGSEQSATTQQRLAEIEQQINAFAAYQAQMLDLASSPVKNSAALGYSIEHLNPQSGVILQTLTEMLVAEEEQPVTEERRELYKTLQDLRYAWATLMNNVRMYVFLGNDDARGNMELFVTGTGELITRLRDYGDLLTFEQETGIELLEQNRDSFAKNLKTLVSLHQGERAQTDAYLIRNEIGPILANINQSLNILVTEQRDLISNTSEELRSEVSGTSRTVMVLLLLGIVLGCGIAWLAARLITRPVRLAAAAMQDIAHGEGDLTQRLEVVGNDEVAELARGFNQFAGDIQTLLGQVTSSATQISRAAQLLSDASVSAEHSISQQNSKTAQISTAIEEMSATSHEVAQHAELAAEAASHADRETSSGRKVVTEVLSEVGKLADETQAAADCIEQLGRNIEEVSSVIDVIRSVAEQTNLLALNAAIEAARAGEQGRGFAVVADEVRTLASRTQKSTEDIQSKVESLQQVAQVAVDKMLRNRASADATMALTSSAGESLQTITQAVANISDMSEQIARAAEQQSTVAGEVSGNIVNVTELANQTDASTQQVFANANDLMELSATLQKLVTRFKV